jgi:hypothetical protein
MIISGKVSFFVGVADDDSSYSVGTVVGMAVSTSAFPMRSTYRLLSFLYSPDVPFEVVLDSLGNANVCVV